MTPESLVAELCDRGVTIEAAGGELRLNAPTGAITPDLLAAVKSCKTELMELLPETANASKADADREFDRFAAVAVPFPDGSGWFDPTQEPVPVSVPIEDWRKFEIDCASLGWKKKNTKGGGIQIQSRIIDVTNRGETT